MCIAISWGTTVREAYTSRHDRGTTLDPSDTIDTSQKYYTERLDEDLSSDNTEALNFSLAVKK